MNGQLIIFNDHFRTNGLLVLLVLQVLLGITVGDGALPQSASHRNHMQMQMHSKCKCTAA